MYMCASKAEKKQDGRAVEDTCWMFLQPLLEELHDLVDRRIVKTRLDLVLMLLMHCHRNSGLLLSELGDHLCLCQTLANQDGFAFHQIRAGP